MVTRSASLSDELVRERLAHDKASGWRRVPADINQLVMERRHHHGRWGVDTSRFKVAVDITNRVRYVDPSVEHLVTEGEKARAYLNRCLAATPLKRKKLNYPWPKENDPEENPMRFLELKRHLPLHFDPPEQRTAAWSVIDIRSAFWSLLRQHTADVKFMVKSQGLLVTEGTVEFVRADEVDKDLGRAIYGVMSRTEQVVFDSRKGGPGSHEDLGPMGNGRYLSPCAVGLMAYQMHAIALEAIRLFGAIHVAVDAYIVPRSEGHNLIHWLASEWGLDSGFVCSGRGHVWDWNHWRIGGQKAGPEGRNQRGMGVKGGAPIEVDKGPKSNLMKLDRADIEELATINALARAPEDIEVLRPIFERARRIRHG